MSKYCVVYVRVSTERQLDGYSLDSQVDLCTKKAQQEAPQKVIDPIC